MHHANHFYGHAHIMARYVGLDHPPRIWGYLQHGWNMHDGFAVGTVFAPGYPKFVWSEACVRRGWASGLRNYMVVGAPWLYLLELERQREWLETAPPRRGTIVYPFHGWEGQAVIGSHLDYLDEVRQTEGDVPITVCLYWNEYDDPKVRRQYEDAGVRVITHGQRGYLWQDTEPAFLYRQLHEMRNHARVVSNRLSSAVIYAAAAGVEVGVYGDPMELESDHAILGGVGKPRRMFPQMQQVRVPPHDAAVVAAVELGRDFMLGPQEVIDVFGWTPEISRPLPSPPAPPLEPDRSFFARQSRARHRAWSHRAPGGVEERSGAASAVELDVRPAGETERGDAPHITAEVPAAQVAGDAAADPAVTPVTGESIAPTRGADTAPTSSADA